MKHMAFAMTTEQILNRSKTVTRRIGWKDLKPGTLLQAIEKGQGLKKGERVRKLGVIRAVNVRRERLDAITQEDVEREGFPHLTPAEFITMFCDSHRVLEPPVWPWLQPTTRKARPSDDVTRIEFGYEEGEPQTP